MIEATIDELERAGVTDGPKVALADAQYWNEQHLDEVIANKHIQVLIPPDRGGRTEPRPGWTGGATYGCELCWPQHTADSCTEDEYR